MKFIHRKFSCKKPNKHIQEEKQEKKKEETSFISIKNWCIMQLVVDITYIVQMSLVYIPKEMYSENLKAIILYIVDNGILVPVPIVLFLCLCYLFRYSIAYLVNKGSMVEQRQKFIMMNIAALLLGLSESFATLLFIATQNPLNTLMMVSLGIVITALEVMSYYFSADLEKYSWFENTLNFSEDYEERSDYYKYKYVPLKYVVVS